MEAAALAVLQFNKNDKEKKFNRDESTFIHTQRISAIFINFQLDSLFMFIITLNI